MLDSCSWTGKAIRVQKRRNGAAVLARNPQKEPVAKGKHGGTISPRGWRTTRSKENLAMSEKSYCPECTSLTGPVEVPAYHQPRVIMNQSPHLSRVVLYSPLDDKANLHWGLAPLLGACIISVHLHIYPRGRHSFCPEGTVQSGGVHVQDDPARQCQGQDLNPLGLTHHYPRQSSILWLA